MDLARHFATWSKDPRKQVGAVVIGQHGQILAQGYNGMPRGMCDSTDLMEPDVKLFYMVHAEMNCIYNASLSGISLEGSTMYVSGFPPCSSCAQGIIQAGIRTVYCDEQDYLEMKKADRWKAHIEATELMFYKCNVSLRYLN